MKATRQVTSLIFACACCIAATASGAKLSKSVPQGWGEDFEAAKQEAANDGKLLLIAFSGSDWCGWCVKMEKEIYSDKKFISRAKKNFVLVMIDNPRNKEILSDLAKKQNGAVTSQFGISGYPTTVVALPSGKEVKRFMGFQNGGVKAFLDKLAEVAQNAPSSADSKSGGGAGLSGSGKDDRFFHKSSENAKIMAREAKQRKENATNEFVLKEFARIRFGLKKSDGTPTLCAPYNKLSKLGRLSYNAKGELVGMTLEAQPKEVRAMSPEAFQTAVCDLVNDMEDDLGIRFAVSGGKIDFIGKNTTIKVLANRSLGQLSVQLSVKKR